MKFTESHEWVELDNNTKIATIGVTHYAQHELGDIVYVELPQIGKTVSAGAEAAVLESTKAAADVYSPVTGLIQEVNTRLKEAPELVNQSPEKEGWIFKVKISNAADLEKLMDLKTYQELTKGT